MRRLAPEFYRGRAAVHWALTVSGRRSGWLDEHAHAVWREIWLHAACRYGVLLPVYCLMPDHAHALVVGFEATSDQLRALSFVRRYSARMFAGRAGAESAGAEREAVPLRLRSGSASLPPKSPSLPPRIGWQKQAYDHVLRDRERTRSGFAAVAHYIVQNPVRAGLVKRAEDWPFSGSLVAGWPDLDWRQVEFWPRWWQIFSADDGVDEG